MSLECEIEVKCTVFGANRAQQSPPPTVRLWRGSDQITVRDLIALTVEAQINQLMDEHAAIPENVSEQLAWHYLSPQEIALQSETGRIRLVPFPNKPKGIDVAAAIQAAQVAFERRIFRIAVDGRMVLSLEQQVPLSPKTPVTFVRLTPLVGG